jgi:hypothetical protein
MQKSPLRVFSWDIKDPLSKDLSGMVGGGGVFPSFRFYIPLLVYLQSTMLLQYLQEDTSHKEALFTLYWRILNEELLQTFISSMLT